MAAGFQQVEQLMADYNNKRAGLVAVADAQKTGAVLTQQLLESQKKGIELTQKLLANSNTKNARLMRLLDAQEKEGKLLKVVQNQAQQKLGKPAGSEEQSDEPGKSEETEEDEESEEMAKKGERGKSALADERQQEAAAEAARAKMAAAGKDTSRKRRHAEAEEAAGAADVVKQKRRRRSAVCISFGAQGWMYMQACMRTALFTTLPRVCCAHVAESGRQRRGQCRGTGEMHCRVSFAMSIAYATCDLHALFVLDLLQKAALEAQLKELEGEPSMKRYAKQVWAILLEYIPLKAKKGPFKKDVEDALEKLGWPTKIKELRELVKAGTMPKIQ